MDGLSLFARLMPHLACQFWDAAFHAMHACEVARWQTHQRLARILARRNLAKRGDCALNECVAAMAVRG